MGPQSIELSLVVGVVTLFLLLPGQCEGEHQHHEAVNRVMTVWAGEDRPTPDLACLVGFLSIETRNLWRINCSQANNYRSDQSKDPIS